MRPYDRRLLEIFSAEQGEHLQRIRSIVDSLASMPADARPGAIEEILRRAHTLKGASRAVGLESSEQLAHRLEALLGRARDRELAPALLAAVHRGLDAMEDILAAAIGGRQEPDTSAALHALDEGDSGATGEPASPVAVEQAATEPAAAGLEFMRVNAANVDGLIRASSQLVTSLSASSEVEEKADEAARRASHSLTEFLRLLRAARPFLREHQDDVEVAPLRECLEYADRELRGLTEQSRGLASSQRHHGWELRQRVTDLHQNALKVRMIPAESIFGAFGAMTRQIAQDEGKEIEFRAQGLEAQADRMVLQALKDPVMHLLRNAASHGIETPESRLGAGKSRTGNVNLEIDVRGDRLNVSVEDDGVGLNLAAVRDRAVALRLLGKEEAATESPQEIAKLIFRPGFSTSAAVTNISGRGMGLAVVQETVDRLQGEVEVYTSDRGGLRTTLSVPLSISTQQLLLVETGGFVFGIPTRSVRQLVRIRRSGLQTLDGREVFVLEGKPIPLTRLSDMLGLAPEAGQAPAAENRDAPISVVIMVWGDKTAGVIVNRLLDEREAVVKDLGLPNRMTGLTNGGVLLEDGRVALALNPAALLDTLQGAAKRTALQKAQQPKEKPAHRILVVDDSLTTRSLEKSILEAHGFQVSLAVDGIEALEKLGAERFDLVITDVTMPRMDGMQLLERMKGQKSTEHIPVIMVTSMEKKEDQQRGMSLGADAYIVKRKFDQQELLHIVRQIL